jgi:hypothetical protein
MSARLRTAFLLVAAGLGLGACSTYDGYGYGGLSVGYGGGYCDPYYYDCYSGYGGYGGGYAYDPWYGWYGDYYYPGIGIYVFDRYGRRHRWNDDHRRYWEGRRGRWEGRDWNDRRWERWEGYRGDRRDWRRDGDRNWRRGDGDRSGWRDRSQRQEWNENQGSWRGRGMRSEAPTVGGETRVRTEGSRGRTEGARPSGEWRPVARPERGPRQLARPARRRLIREPVSFGSGRSR